MGVPTESPARQIAVSGYYGCGNAGDEAVLAGIRSAFQRHPDARAEIVALSQNPEDTAATHGIRSIYRMNASAVRQTVKESGLLLSGGGSLLQDSTSVRSLLYYLWVCRLAYSCEVPFMFYAQGIGPLRRPMSRALVRMVAERAAHITVRDEPSAALLRRIGVSRVPVEVTADPAFALQPAAPDEVSAALSAEGLDPGGKYLAVALRRWGPEASNAAAEYGELVTKLVSECGMPVILTPMQAPADLCFAEDVAAAAGGSVHILRQRHSPEMLIGIMQQMQAVVGMRLHALIFAVRAAVPVFGLSYDPKVESLMRRLELNEMLEPWKGFDAADVAARVSSLLQRRAEISGKLAVKAAEMEREALRNVDIALGVMQQSAKASAKTMV